MTSRTRSHDYIKWLLPRNMHYKITYKAIIIIFLLPKHGLKKSLKKIDLKISCSYRSCKSQILERKMKSDWTSCLCEIVLKLAARHLSARPFMMIFPCDNVHQVSVDRCLSSRADEKEGEKEKRTALRIFHETDSECREGDDKLSWTVNVIYIRIIIADYR